MFVFREKIPAYAIHSMDMIVSHIGRRRLEDFQNDSAIHPTPDDRFSCSNSAQHGALRRASSEGACTDTWQYYVLPCVYKTCESNVAITMPNYDGDDELVGCTSVMCCSQYFTTCDFNGECVEPLLRRPEVRARVAQVAETARVLVADCKGRYVPYEGLSFRNNVRAAEIVNEHILR